MILLLIIIKITIINVNGLVPEYLSNFLSKIQLEMSKNREILRLIFRYHCGKLKMGKTQYHFVDLSFGNRSKLILNRHPPMPHSTKG